jgi:hypothetical protein
MFVEGIVANRIGTNWDDAPTALSFLGKDILVHACASCFIATNCLSVTVTSVPFLGRYQKLSQNTCLPFMHWQLLQQTDPSLC